MTVLAACSSGGARVGAQPSWRGSGMRTSSAVGPVTFAPTSEPVSHYNGSVPAPPHTPLNDAVIAAVRNAAARAGLGTPVPDARLFRACAELAEIVPEEGVVGYTLVEFALQRNGLIEPSPHLLVVWGSIDSTELIVQQLAPRVAEILEDGANARMGVGIARRNADGTGAVVFALQGSGVSTSPIPRSVAADGTIAIDAVVDARYREPEVFVTHDDGLTERIELSPGRRGGFIARIACSAHKGRQQIEITASDAAGSTVLANFPVWCGAAPPLSVTIDPVDDTPVTTQEAAEQRLFARVNRDRVAAGLSALVWDDHLAGVARGHSEEMRRTHVVAHISPVTGSAADRVRAANIKTGIVLENVARAYGVGEAHDGLMNSPGHRANIMSPVATHIGLGVRFGDEVSGRREMFVTQVFMRVPPRIDPAKAVETVHRKLAAAHQTLVVTTELGGLAQQLADQLAAGKSREQAYEVIRSKVDRLGRVYQRVGSVITATADLDTLDGAALLGDAVARDVGIGVAQGPHPDIGDQAIWVIVLLADRRQ